MMKITSIKSCVPVTNFVAAFALMVGLPVSVNAQTVLIDFGNDASFRGLSVDNPDANGNYWNSLRTGVFYQNLIDIDNNVTTIDFGFSTPVATDSFNGPAGPTGESTLETDVQFTDIDAAALGNLGGALEAAFDYVAGPDMPGNNQVRFEIQQLDPAKKYNLTFFGSHKFSTDSTTVYSVYSDNTYSTQVGTASLDVQEPVEPFNLHNRDKVATITNLSPPANNILYVQFIGSNGGLGYLNDMQIEAITPELDGDYNENGTVDAADYVLWRDNPAAHGGDPVGYNTWRANFGRTPAGGGLASGSAVPEVSSFTLALLTAMGLFSLRQSHAFRESNGSCGV
jgi:hypothetical protein